MSLLIKGRQMCNFSIKADSMILARNAAGEDTPYVVLQPVFDNERQSKPFTVLLSELETYDWRKQDFRCNYNPDMSVTKINRYLAFNVREQLSALKIKIMNTIEHNGLYKFDGMLCYCAGQDIICSKGYQELDFEIKKQGVPHNLDIDINLSPIEACDGILRIIAISPDVARILLAYKLGFLMRQAFIDAGFTPRTVIYVYGNTGSLKTTFTSFFLQTYDRSVCIKEPTRLNGSIPSAVNILLEVKDDVVIFDDLCPAESRHIRAKQEELLFELTRFIGDGTVPAKMIGKSVLEKAPECGVVLTGEYLIGSGSDAARLLPVEMDKPDGEMLKHFQDNPLINSTFYKNLLTWYVENYNEIVSTLDKLLKNCREKNTGIHARLQETYFFLSSSFLLRFPDVHTDTTG